MNLVHLETRTDSGEIEAPGDWLGPGRWRLALWGVGPRHRIGLGLLEADIYLLVRASFIADPLVLWGEQARLRIKLVEVEDAQARFDLLQVLPHRMPPARVRARRARRDLGSPVRFRPRGNERDPYRDETPLFD